MNLFFRLLPRTSNATNGFADRDICSQPRRLGLTLEEHDSSSC